MDPGMGWCTADCETCPLQVSAVTGFLCVGLSLIHMWQIPPRSGARLKLRLRVQKKAAVTQGGWLPSQVRGRSKTGSSFVASWLLAGSPQPALLALQQGSCSSFPAHHGGSLITTPTLRATDVTCLGLRRCVLMAPLQVFYNPNSISFCGLR